MACRRLCNKSPSSAEAARILKMKNKTLPAAQIMEMLVNSQVTPQNSKARFFVCAWKLRQLWQLQNKHLKRELEVAEDKAGGLSKSLVRSRLP